MREKKREKKYEKIKERIGYEKIQKVKKRR